MKIMWKPESAKALKIKAKAATNKPDLNGEIIGHKRLKVCVVEKSLSCIVCSYITLS